MTGKKKFKKLNSDTVSEPISMSKRLEVGYQRINISSIIKANWNYKEDNEELKESLKENMRLHGQIENIIIRQITPMVFECINGNHRLDVANELGWNTVFCYNIGVITKAQAIRIAIETNETRFISDNLKLAKAIREVSSEISMSDLETTLPFSKTELKEFDELLDFDWDDFDNSKIDGGKGEGSINFSLKFDLTEDQYRSWGHWLTINKTGGTPKEIAESFIEAIRKATSLVE